MAISGRCLADARVGAEKALDALNELNGHAAQSLSSPTRGRNLDEPGRICYARPMVKLTREDRKAGLALFERVWEDIEGHSPDVICFALISVLATLIGGAAADPSETAQNLARNLIKAVERPPEKSSLN